MGPPGSRDLVKHIAYFLIQKILRDVNEVIVHANHDTGACYGVSKYLEIVFERGKNVRGDGLEVQEQRMKTVDPDKYEIYNILVYLITI